MARAKRTCKGTLGKSSAERPARIRVVPGLVAALGPRRGQAGSGVAATLRRRRCNSVRSSGQGGSRHLQAVHTSKARDRGWRCGDLQAACSQHRFPQRLIPKRRSAAAPGYGAARRFRRAPRGGARASMQHRPPSRVCANPRGVRPPHRRGVMRCGAGPCLRACPPLCSRSVQVIRPRAFRRGRSSECHQPHTRSMQAALSRGPAGVKLCSGPVPSGTL